MRQPHVTSRGAILLITVTLNPAMDRTVMLEELAVGDVNRVHIARSDPGGKGINVSRVLRELGTGSLAMGFVSGSIGRFIEASLNEIGIADDFIHTPGQTRTNLSILETKSRRQTSLNEPGPLTDLRWGQELKLRVAPRVVPGTWVVLAGSVPPGLPARIYADLAEVIAQRGGTVVLDADGEPLAKGILARPCLVKPNRAELERLLGKTLESDKDIVAAAKGLQSEGITYVVVSLGADGAIAVGPGGALRGYAPKVHALSTTGAGDSMVAGIVLKLSEGRDLAEGLRLGLAAGAAATLSPGTMLCRREDVEQLLPHARVEQL